MKSSKILRNVKRLVDPGVETEIETEILQTYLLGV